MHVVSHGEQQVGNEAELGSGHVRNVNLSAHKVRVALTSGVILAHWDFTPYPRACLVARHSKATRRDHRVRNPVPSAPRFNGYLHYHDLIAP